MISTDNIIQRLKARGTKSQIVVLDACRQNPFRQAGGRSVGGARGLAPTQTPGGVFVIYSAGVGEVALDRLSDNDADPNSVFTRSFLPLFTDPAQSLVSVAKETRLRVKSLASTIGMTQSPADDDEIDGDLFLARTGGGRGCGADRAGTATHSPAAACNAADEPCKKSGLFVNVARNTATSSRTPIACGSTPNTPRGLTRDQLRLARNEIYARRGRFFRDQQLIFAPFSGLRLVQALSPGRSRSTRSSRRTSI